MSREGLHCWHPLGGGIKPSTTSCTTQNKVLLTCLVYTLSRFALWCVFCRRFFQLPSVTILGAMAFTIAGPLSWRFGMASCGCLSSEVKRKNDGTMGNAETPCVDQQARFLSAIVDKGVFGKLKKSTRGADVHALCQIPPLFTDHTGISMWPSGSAVRSVVSR